MKVEYSPHQINNQAKEDTALLFFSQYPSAKPVVQLVKGFLQKRNNDKAFVNATVRKIGYPRWDKALQKGEQRYGRGLTDSVEVIYIPFVREEENFTNASMVIEMTPSDTTFKYLCDWQFHQKDNGLPGLNNTAEAHALFFMNFDKLVFGHTRFKVSDDSLFVGNSMTHDTGLRVIEIQSDGNRSARAMTAVTICFTYLSCPSSYCQGVGYCDYPNCPDEVCIMRTDCEVIPDPDIPGGGSSSGGGSGSGGSGTGLPPDCGPMTGYRSNNANENCETGWQPLPPPPPPPPPLPDTLINPCLDAAILQNSPSFISYMQEMKDSSNSNREYGYLLFKDPSGVFGNTPHGLLQGPGNYLGLYDFFNNYMIDIVVHCHFNTGTDSTKGLSVFSPDDLWSMCKVFKDGNVVDPGTYTMALVTKNGTQYLLKIENLTKFRNWATNFTSGDFNLFKRVFSETLNIRPTNNNDENERNFLRYIMSNGGSGLKLFRGSSDFTQWTPLGLDGNRNVIVQPC